MNPRRWKVIAAVTAVGLVLGALGLPTAAPAADANIVYGWGTNFNGQTGAPKSPEAAPAPINMFASDVTQVSAGDVFSLALCADGTVWAWGDNHLGQLGNEDPTVTSTNIPGRVHGLPAGIVQVSAGGTFSLALASDGSVWAWGWNDYGQLGTAGAASWKAVRVPVVSAVRKVAAGWQFSMALTGNGEVWTWGDDREGELGDGLPLQTRATPRHVPVGYGFTDIAAGLKHALALRPGSLWAWGDNAYGQLGNATVAYSPTSVRVSRFTDNAYQIAAGSNHSLALDRDGSVWAWGGNTSGQLGNGVVDNDPHNIPVHLAATTFPAPVTQISAGAAISIAVLSDGGLWLWGNNQYGTVDASYPRDQYKPLPTPFALSDVRQASVGGYFVLAVAHRVGVLMPNVVGELRVSAVPQLQALGLTVNVVMTADTPYCDNINYVVAQSPSAGTFRLPGATAVIWVAQRPPGGCF